MTSVGAAFMLLLSSISAIPIRCAVAGSALFVAGSVLTACGRKKKRKPEDYFAKKHYRFVKKAQEAKIDLLFLGDSITEYWLTDGKDVWSRAFSQWKTENFGIAGDTTQGVLWRVNNGEIDGIKPKAVVLLIGTNDLSLGALSAQQIAGNVSQIIDTIKTKSPDSKIVLLAVFPRGRRATDPARKLVNGVNEELTKLGDGKQVIYLDLGKEFLDAGGEISEDIMPDYLHLSAKGYEKWASALQSTLKEIM